MPENEGYFLPLLFRRSAQYFFMRSDTAHRAAADIRLRRRLPRAAAGFAPSSGNA